jgi:MinD superfamily P-loop ATPase
MILKITSGEGGTGKTAIVVNFALSLPKGTVESIDGDVEEPNSHLFLSPSIHQVTSMRISVSRIELSEQTVPHHQV